jgi:hypothetical protein
MSRKVRNNLPEPAGEPDAAVVAYLRALEDVYPAAKGCASVVRRQDNRVVVSVPLPARAQERMRLFDQMAEVATDLLLQTDQYIVLSAQ